MRRERSQPLVDALRDVLDAALSRLIAGGQFEIGSNIAERALRGVAVGRRNWLFAVSKVGGERGAAIYTIIQTCKANSVIRSPASSMSSRRSLIIGTGRLEELMP